MPHQTLQTVREVFRPKYEQVISLSFACISRHLHKESTRCYAFQHKVCFENMKSENLIIFKFEEEKSVEAGRKVCEFGYIWVVDVFFIEGLRKILMKKRKN